jgi:molybdopterin-guanine dinucleotide biosynthesis protein
MKSCTRCLNTETADTISFNTAGACSVCVQVDHKLTAVDWNERKLELHSIITQARQPVTASTTASCPSAAARTRRTSFGMS